MVFGQLVLLLVISRVVESEAKYPTSTTTPTFQNFRLPTPTFRKFPTPTFT